MADDYGVDVYLGDDAAPFTDWRGAPSCARDGDDDAEPTDDEVDAVSEILGVNLDRLFPDDESDEA